MPPIGWTSPSSGSLRAGKGHAIGDSLRNRQQIR
jgi:hypothetical protein